MELKDAKDEINKIKKAIAGFRGSLWLRFIIWKYWD